MTPVSGCSRVGPEARQSLINVPTDEAESGIKRPTPLKGPLVLVQVFSTPQCQQCRATYRALETAGVPFQVTDLSQDSEARARILDLGYTQAPVVLAGDQHWSGFRPDLIKQLGNA